MTKEKFRDCILAEYGMIVGDAEIDILNGILTKYLGEIEFAKKNELVVYDDSNQKMLQMFFTLQSKKLSEKTIKVYSSTLNEFSHFVNKPLNEVTSIDIELYLAHKSSTVGEVALNGYKRNISAFYSWFVDKDYMVKNPCSGVKPFKEIKKPIDHLDAVEVEMMKNGCQTSRQRALFEFLYCTGLRVGEIPPLKISDIDFTKGEVTVYGHKTKEWDVVFLDTVAMGYIKKYISERGLTTESDEPLFSCSFSSDALSENSISRELKEMAAHGGLERRVYVHLMRKSLASRVVRQGGSIHDASLLLRHKDSTVTGQHYAFIDKSYKRRVFDMYAARV